jgi:branched-chain amino acid transport system ATP-binding protein
MAEPLLAISALAISYGRVKAVHGVDLHVQQGEVVAILGANGAGKSSIARAVVGLTRATGGTIRLDGRDVTPMPSDRRAGLGLAFVPEGRRVFADLTVTENLLMGAYLVPREASRRMDEVVALFPRLAERRTQLAATLSGGEQQMLAMGRALMRGPRLIVMDEPSLGLSPIMVQVIYRTIADLRRSGITILLAEQSASLALSLADRAYLLETGRVILDGPAAALREDPKVRQSYLGIA